MSSNTTLFASKSSKDPSDPYAATPEVRAESPAPTTIDNETESNDEDEDNNLRIDGDAYKALTKPDPNWATTFNPVEVRGKQWRADYLYLDKEGHFEMLGAINRGEQNGPKYEHKELHTYRFWKHMVEIIGERLNMTEHQVSRATRRATNIDGEKFGQRVELAVFCTCAYVVHQDKTGFAEKRRYYPGIDDERLDQLFKDVAEEFELRQKRIDKQIRSFSQKFEAEELPPEGFDERKPNWKSYETPDGVVSELPTTEERHGQPWRGGI